MRSGQIEERVIRARADDDSAPGPPTKGPYRIDDLARLAGTTVRNVRAYQDRGLVPPPEKAGRVGWYSEAHLARVRLVGEMLSRGYTLSNIGELIGGWIRGQDLSDLLGLDVALMPSWGEDGSRNYSRQELDALLSGLGGEHLDAAVDMGLVSREDDRFRVADPRLIEAAGVLVEAGVPVEVVFALGAEIAAATDRIAALYVETITRHVTGEGSHPLSPAEVRRLSDLGPRLSPLAKDVVGAGLAAALERRIGAELGQWLSHGRPLMPDRAGTVTGAG